MSGEKATWRPQMVLLVGLQASGKSTFVRERLFDTHVRLNLDMLHTRHRLTLLRDACLAAKQSFVVDNTNPSREERAEHIAAARVHGFEVVGYYFRSVVAECTERNDRRDAVTRVPIAGLLGTAARLERPTLDEGFDQLWYVRIADGSFACDPWQTEGT